MEGMVSCMLCAERSKRKVEFVRRGTREKVSVRACISGPESAAMAKKQRHGCSKLTGNGVVYGRTAFVRTEWGVEGG